MSCSEHSEKLVGMFVCSQVLVKGINSVLIILSAMEVCVSIIAALLASKAFRSSPGRENEVQNHIWRLSKVHTFCSVYYCLNYLLTFASKSRIFHMVFLLPFADIAGHRAVLPPPPLVER